jgi:DNA-directed RNA polymerase subunit K/omega
MVKEYSEESNNESDKILTESDGSDEDDDDYIGGEENDFQSDDEPSDNNIDDDDEDNEDDEDDGEFLTDENDDYPTEYGDWIRVPDEDRDSDPVMTYYELVRLIGVRARQLELGAVPLIKGADKLTPSIIANLEIISKTCPLIISRYLPGHKYELWKIEELEQIYFATGDYFTPKNFDRDAFLAQYS